MTFSPDDRFLAATSSDHRVLIWDLEKLRHELHARLTGSSGWQLGPRGDARSTAAPMRMVVFQHAVKDLARGRANAGVMEVLHAATTTTRSRTRERLAALQQTSLLDTPPEEAFDRLTRLATTVLRVPVALVSLVDGNRQFFKSCVGLPEPLASLRQTPLTHSFCKHVVASGEPLIVSDARSIRSSRTIRRCPSWA